MKVVNMHDAKTNLSRLVAEAAAGEPFIIARAGKPLVRVVPVRDGPSPGAGRLGFLEGRYAVPDDIKSGYADEIDALFGGDAKG